MRKQYFNTLFSNVGWNLYHLIYKIDSRQLQQELRKIVEIHFLTLKKLFSREQYSIDYSLGILYCHSVPPQFQKSKKYLESALKFSKTNFQKAKALDSLGVLYYEQKQYHKALDFHSRALKEAKYKSIPLYNIAFAYEKTGNKQKAIKAALASIEEMKKEIDLKHTTNPKRVLKQLIKRCREGN